MSLLMNVYMYVVVMLVSRIGGSHHHYSIMSLYVCDP